MHKVDLPKGEWAKEKATAGGYYIRVLPVEKTDESGNVIVVSVEDKIDHKPAKKDFSDLEARWLSGNKRWKKREVEDYAKSGAVKVFAINGVSGWLDSEARVSIRRSVADKAAQGRDSVTVYVSGHGFTMTPAKAEEILAAVEVYASDCYDVTENHKAAVDAMDNVDAVESYDYAKGYPQPLQFEL